MEKQTISHKLPNGFKLITLVGAIFAAIVAPLEATNIPPESALTIDGGHVVVNDDDTNQNEIWDKSEEVTIDNKGLEGPKTSAKSEPVLRQFSFTAKWADCPGVLIITPSIPPAHIKLWKDAEKTEPFTFEYSYAVTEGPAKTVTFWVEGIEPTEAFDSIKFTAVYTITNPTSGLSSTATGTIAFGVTQADLDIDSNNQNGTEATGYDEDEDQIEFSFKDEHPGKILLETRNDVDNDNVIDSVDGISELPSTGGTPTVAGLKLIPMRVTLKKPFTTATAKVKFSYRASVPRLGEGIAANGQDANGNTLYRITTTGMRLWIKDGGEQDGDKRTSGKDVGTDGGDFIPAETEIKWLDLKPKDSSATEKIIYVEYVDVEGSDKEFSKEDIVVEISDDTSAAKGYIQYGEAEKQPLPTTKSPDGVNVALLPVEVKIPIIVDDKDTGKIESTSRLRVAKIYEGLSDTNFGSTAADLPSEIYDRFYVKIPNVSGLKVKISTLRTPLYFDGRTFDDATEIEMKSDPQNPNYLISSPQLLVRFDIDDEAHFGGSKPDDEVNDNTHKTNCLGPLEVIILLNGNDVGSQKINTNLNYYTEVDKVVIIPDSTGSLAIESVDFEDFFNSNIKQHYSQVDINVGLGDVTAAPNRPPGMTTNNGVFIEIGQDPTTVLKPVVDVYGTESAEDIQMFVFTSMRQEYYKPIPGGLAIDDAVIALSYTPGEGTSPTSKFSNTIFFQTNHMHPVYNKSEDGVVSAHELAHVLTSGGHYKGEWDEYNILLEASTLNRPTNAPSPEFFQCRRFTRGQEKTMHQSPLVFRVR